MAEGHLCTNPSWNEVQSQSSQAKSPPTTKQIETPLSILFCAQREKNISFPGDVLHGWLATDFSRSYIPSLHLDLHDLTQADEAILSSRVCWGVRLPRCSGGGSPRCSLAALLSVEGVFDRSSDSETNHQIQHIRGWVSHVMAAPTNWNHARARLLFGTGFRKILVVVKHSAYEVGKED